jgi:hypothetical protein
MIVSFLLIASLVITTTAAYRPSTQDALGSVVSSEAAVTRYIQRRNKWRPTTPIRPKWGVDNTCPGEYWFDDRIHTLGNHGFWGAFHAAVAPISTKIIDMAAYNGIDIRKQVRTKKLRAFRVCRSRLTVVSSHFKYSCPKNSPI